MRTIGKLALAVGLAAVLSAPAQAQFGRRGGGAMAGFGALMSPAGQKELNLSEDQVAKLRDVSENLRTTMGEKFQSLQDVPQEERREKMQAIMSEVSEGLQKEVKGILNDDQMKRYQEISLQSMGIAAFEQEEVAKKLELTDDQKQQITTIQEDSRTQARSAFQNAQGDRQAAFQKIREIQDQAEQKVHALLTDQQKETWKGMTGKEFHFEPGPGGRPGGRRGPRN